MSKTKVFSLFLFVLVTYNFGLSNLFAQNIAINATGNPPHASAILDIDATEMSPKAGVLLPRMTTVQRNAIPSPEQSLTIYNTSTNTLDFYNGSVWRAYTDALASSVVAGGTGLGIGVAFNTTGAAPHPSALLDISSTTQGILLPRTVDASIDSPTEGLLFFSTESLGMKFYTGSEWATAGCNGTGVAGAGGSQTAIGSSINISGEAAHHSAIIDLSSTTLGLKLPKLSDAERDAIPSPAQGLLFYNTTNTRIEFFNGTEWRYLSGEGFQTEWTTTAPGQTITLPLNSGNSSAFNCTVYWGDGSSSEITFDGDADRIHTYAAAGTYTVEIIGQCEGWSFNNGGDKLKIKKILSWGDLCHFNGFKYLTWGFFGCTNLTSIPSSGAILASGNGCTSLAALFWNCTGLTGSIPAELFSNHLQVTTFHSTFMACIALTGSIPAGLFDNNTLVSSDGFTSTFASCGGLTGSIPTGLFDQNTLVSSDGFDGTFYYCSGLTGSIPAGLFDNNTLVSSDGFRLTFMGCYGLTSIPAGLFDNNTLVSTNGFYGTFSDCTGLTGSIPAGLFDNNTLVSTNGFDDTFSYCSELTEIPTNLFKFNTLCTSFQRTFLACTKIKLNRNIFFSDGEAGTRFLNKSVSFFRCFERSSYSGALGEAPPLWTCSFGSGTATKTNCYAGAGNSVSSLSNYASIPGAWK